MEKMDVEDAIEYRPVKHTSRCKYIFYTFVITVFILTIIYTSALTYLYFTRENQDITNNNTLIQINENGGIKGLFCTISKFGKNTYKYPSQDKFLYAINYNATISQANYVYYISTSGGNGCKGSTDKDKKNWLNDPHGINKLTTNDYINTNYDRGHLVPNADYGCDTYYITNAVPMNAGFNRGVWNQLEQSIRTHHAGKLVYKGCDYTNYYITSDFDNKMYIPLGCYYMIFDSSTLTDINKETVGNVLDYGYYLNEKGSTKEFKYPSWAKCTMNN